MLGARGWHARSMSKVKAWQDEGGSVQRLRLASSPGNILDRAMVEELDAALGSVTPATLATVIDHEGLHFSYGASIPEHAPGEVEAALPAMTALVRRMLAHPVPLACVIRGRCLGGGLELALCCDVLFASTDATFATPEVKLGAFAPYASVLLPRRIGDGLARDLVLSGRTLEAPAALAAGLVQSVTDDPLATALGWVSEHLMLLSPVSQRIAVRAARLVAAREIAPLLDEVERLYLDELMAHPDAAEGVSAFLSKRAPRWAPPR